MAANTEPVPAKCTAGIKLAGAAENAERAPAHALEALLRKAPTKRKCEHIVLMQKDATEGRYMLEAPSTPAAGAPLQGEKAEREPLLPPLGECVTERAWLLPVMLHEGMLADLEWMPS